MTESDRSKTIEVMAEKIYYAVPQIFLGDTVHWRELPSLFPHLRQRAISQAEHALTAYESHLHASGMAVVPKAWLDLFEQEAATWARILPHPQAGNSDLRYLHSLAELRAMLAASPDGKALIQEASAEAQSAVATPPSGKAFQPMGSAEEKGHE